MSKDGRRRAQYPQNIASLKSCGVETVERPLLSEFEGTLGQQLRRYYDVRLAEPMPEKLTRLLDELAKSSNQS
jgi:hypothetical protein